MSKKEDKLLKIARKQFAMAEDADSIARNEAREDLSIYEGKGIWDERLRSARLNDPKGARPCLTISDLPPRVRQVTNDVRQNKPSIKIRPVDSNSDIETADILNGLWRHIESQSMSDIAYETANFYQVVTGTGYLRLVDGISRLNGEKELFIRPVMNPESVFMDPTSLCPVGSDSRYCFVVEDMSVEDYEAEYGEGSAEEVSGWNDVAGTSLSHGWVTESTVRVAEWMCIEEEVSNKIIDTDGNEYNEDEYWSMEGRKDVMETRTARRTRTMWRKIAGNKIVREIELPISYIPVIRVPGEMYMVDGRMVYKGLVRDSRDAVRMVSYSFSSYVESISVQTKTPYVAAAGQIEGFEAEWAASNRDNAAVLQYNPVSLDGTSPLPAPRREPPPMASQGIIQGLVLSQQALKDVTGMGAASLGQKGNEVSGRAIEARQHEGDVGTFHYTDNLSKAIRHLGTIGIQWIPHIYSDRQVLRILGDDDQSDTVHLDNTQENAVREVPYIDQSSETPEIKIRKIYNINIGSYDVTSTTGPSYSTRRVEASRMLGELFQSAPGLIPLLGDIYIGNQDVPGSQQMADRLKATLPPQVAAVDKAGKDSVKIPPHIVAQMEEMKSQLQEGANIVQQLQAEKEKLEMDLRNKQGEIEARLTIAKSGVEEEKIRSLAAVTIADMNNETKERIAGLEEKLSNMQSVMEHFHAMMQKEDEPDGAGADEPETLEE